MKTLNNNSQEKRTYFSPSIECVMLDNDISLQLQSDPGKPDGGDEVYNTPQHFNNHPFKSNMG